MDAYIVRYLNQSTACIFPHTWDEIPRYQVEFESLPSREVEQLENVRNCRTGIRFDTKLSGQDRCL